jgi:hypothetical protein
MHGNQLAAWKEIGDSAFYIFCHLESIYISKLAKSQNSVKPVVQSKQFWVKYLAEFAVIVSACQRMQKRVKQTLNNRWKKKTQNWVV